MYLEKLQKTSILTAILLTLGGCVTNPSIDNASGPQKTTTATSISERINKTQSVLVEETQHSEAGKRIIGELPTIQNEPESKVAITTPIQLQPKTEIEVLPQGETPKDSPTVIYSEETHPKLSMNRLIPDPNVKLISPPTVLPSTSYHVPSVSEIEKYTPKNNNQSITHIVKNGETVYSIARKYKVSVNNLFKINNLTNKSKLKIGQKIIIKKEQTLTKQKVKKSKTVKKSKK